MCVFVFGGEGYRLVAFVYGCGGKEEVGMCVYVCVHARVRVRNVYTNPDNMSPIRTNSKEPLHHRPARNNHV